MAGNAKAIQPLYNHWSEKSPQEYGDILLDFERYCAEGTIIINKNGQAVPLVLNEAQKVMAAAILKHAFKAVPQPVTVVIHKSRQLGASVLLAALEKYIATRRRNKSIYHLFPTDDLASKFYEQKAKPMLEGTDPNLLPEVYATVKPSIYLKFKKFMHSPINSYVRYGGALSKGAGRSGTNHIVVFDEYAYYERVSQLERGVLATQPKTGLVITVYVSTANGVNHFYDTVKMARKSKDESTMYVFLPWHMMKEYEEEPKGRLKELNSLLDYEFRLIDIFEKEGYHPSTWARKLQWYETVLEKEAKGDMYYMNSEYPSDPDESFAASGSPVFPVVKLMEWKRKVEDISFTRIDNEIYVDSQTHVREMQWIESTDSPIKMYKKPVSGKRYLFGVDPSGGSEDGDFSAGVIIDYDTLEEVCAFNVKMEQTELAELVVNLARFYNNAMIIPERNMGSTLIEFIKLQGYHRMYIDPRSTKNRTLYGVHMTRPVKNDAIKLFRFLMNNNYYEPRDKEFVDDALHFIWQSTQSGMFKRAAASGTDDNNKPYHDDRVMARLNIIATLDIRRWREYGTEEHRRRA